jgi:hypothetical protein
LRATTNTIPIANVVVTPEMNTEASAWRALGRPEADRAEAEMSNGQLRVRVRAYEREKTWAPPYVGEELAGTRQAAERERRTAALRTAEADTNDDETTRERLRTEAEQAKALAEALDARAAELQVADDTWALWLAHTAETRAAAERAAFELENRGLDNSDDGPTPQEWLDNDDRAVEDEHREVSNEHELADIAQQRDADTTTAAPGGEVAEGDLVNDQLASKTEEPDAAADVIPDKDIVADDTTTGVSSDQDAAATQPLKDRELLERQAPADIREVAAAEEQITEADVPRVPSADETAEAVRRAQRALIEIQHRRAAEERHAAAEAEDRAEELSRWHTDDSTAEQASTRPTASGRVRPTRLSVQPAGT